MTFVAATAALSLEPSLYAKLSAIPNVSRSREDADSEDDSMEDEDIPSQFNFQQFLGLTEKVIDHGDVESFAILESLRVNWEARFGKAGIATADETIEGSNMPVKQQGSLDSIDHVECMANENNTPRFRSPSITAPKPDLGPTAPSSLGPQHSGIGRPLYPDAITKACTRLDFARVCVMLDISSKLPKHIVIMKVENEGSKDDRGMIWEEPIIHATTAPSDPMMREQLVLLSDWKWFSDYTSPGNQIWLSWNDDELDIKVLPVHELVIHCRVFIRQIHTAVLVSIVYRENDLGVRRDLWRTLSHIADFIYVEPWLVLGDFNAVVDMSEVCGASGDIRSVIEDFQGFLNYTDRWSSAFYASLTPHTSDHSPLILKGNALGNHIIMFRFDNYLASSPDFVPTMHNIWKHRIVGTVTYSVMRGIDTARYFSIVHIVADWLASKRIFQITDDDGQTRTTPGEIIREFVGIYWSLLGAEPSTRFINLMYRRPWANHIVTVEESQRLIRPVTKEDIKLAIFDIAEDKSPGPDGYSFGFYKAAWPVIGEEVTREIMEFFSTGRFLRQLNATLLALIPKLINQDRDFIFHWKCRELGLFQLCFADDLLLFCEANEQSISLFKRGLGLFAALSGLYVSPTKSHLILSKSAQHNRDMILGVLGFQEGHLPVRYLRLPLIASRLSLSDCIGSSFLLWHDPWHSLGLLILQFPRGLQFIDTSAKAKLQEVISNGQWNWPLILDIECLDIIYFLPTIHGGDDHISWSVEDGQFSNQEDYALFHPPGPKLSWSSLLLGP
ncbi:UNVERIFIED_CONTAM: hypothetical protein Slati_4257100 [Sesamum latifolium]|uniref:Uncharacterized protein n=1 Tax=Sesamum latifolium TaxID=2727402 RepID=A0AAW2TCA5_9LAMI